MSSWLGPIAALVGVSLGGLLSLFAQYLARNRDEARRARDGRHAAYVRFVAAVRDYRTYATMSGAEITAVIHSNEKHVRPKFGPNGIAIKQELERAYISVRMVAVEENVAISAATLAAVVRRFATVVVLPDAKDLKKKIDSSIWVAEGHFVDVARRDTGMKGFKSTHLAVDLPEIDRRLMELYATKGRSVLPPLARTDQTAEVPDDL